MEKQKVYVVNFLENGYETAVNVVCEGVFLNKDTAINECEIVFENSLNNYIHSKEVFEQDMEIEKFNDKFTFYDPKNDYYAELTVVEKELEYK